MPNRSEEVGKSSNKVPSRTTSSEQNIAGVQETEITAQVYVPTEGGWGWVILAASFTALFLLDGVAFTFGSLLHCISEDLNIADSLTALVNSTEITMYFLISPIASALINRYGFRKVTMIGSVICSVGLFASYFTESFIVLLLFYGVITGFGCSLVSMSTTLIVGFYFVKLRSIAMSMVVSGTSFGIMTMYPINVRLVELAGWRTVVLFHSGLYGIIYFLSFVFRPTLLVTVEASGPRSGALESSRLKSSKTSVLRLFSAVPSQNYPTAAEIIQDSGMPAGPSASAVKLTVIAQDKRQLETIESQTEVLRDIADKNVTVLLQPTVSDSSSVPRPMYRDDIFYQGKIESLPVYQRSVESRRTGLDYGLAVTRVAAVSDLRERRGFRSTAVCRVLATMLDPTLLKKCSFLLLCFSGFLTYCGLLVPYVFLNDRNKNAGIDSFHCNYFVSALSLANTGGRLILSSIALKVDPLKLYSFGLIVAGASTMLSCLSYSVLYQYLYSVMFGFHIAVISCLRSVVIVSLFGLDRLTNATGMVIMFLGIGNLFSTPLAGALKNKFGYEVSFYVSGFFITIGGLASLPIKKLSNKEKRKLKSQK